MPHVNAWTDEPATSGDARDAASRQTRDRNDSADTAQVRRLRPRGEEARRGRPDRMRRRRRSAESLRRAERWSPRRRRRVAETLGRRTATAPPSRRRRASIAAPRCGTTAARHRARERHESAWTREWSARATSPPAIRSRGRCPGRRETSRLLLVPRHDHGRAVDSSTFYDTARRTRSRKAGSCRGTASSDPSLPAAC